MHLHGDDRMTKRPRVVSTNPVTWDIYLAHHTPARLLGTVEATDADAAIEAAAKLFDVPDPRKLIPVRRR